MILYGIKNCNTVKAAIDSLKRDKIEFEFHDYKIKGITEVKLKSWSKQVGWESLVMIIFILLILPPCLKS